MWSPWVWVNSATAIRSQLDPTLSSRCRQRAGADPHVEQDPGAAGLDQGGIALGTARKHGKLDGHRIGGYGLPWIPRIGPVRSTPGSFPGQVQCTEVEYSTQYEARSSGLLKKNRRKKRSPDGLVV